MKTVLYTCDICGTEEDYMHSASINCSSRCTSRNGDTYHVCDGCWVDRKTLFQKLWAKFVKDQP